MVPEVGLEPTRHGGHGILSAARLPIPPLRPGQIVLLQPSVGRGANTLALRVKRAHRKIFRLNEKIAALESEIAGTRAELDYHRSINEDAQRDAAVGNYIDREEAGATAADVARFERTLSNLNARLRGLVEKRDRLLERLD